MRIPSFRRRHLPIAALALGVSLASAGTAMAGASHPPVTPKTPPASCVKGVGKGCVTDVAIAKAAGRATYEPGDIVTYTLTVTNTGEAPVARERIVVTDPQLADLAPTTPLTGWLSRGGSVVFTGTRTLTAADCGEVSNTASVALAPKKYGPADVDASNDSATVAVTVAGGACIPVVVPPPAAVVDVSPAAVSPAAVSPPPPKPAPPVCPRPLLRASLHGAQNALAGQVVVFRVRVHASRSAARGVRVRVVLPSGFSLAGSGNAHLLRGGDLVLGVGTLARGATRTLPVALRLDSGIRGRRTLKASVTATCGSAATATAILRAAVRPVRTQPAVAG